MLAPARLSASGRRPRTFSTPQSLRDAVVRALRQSGHADLQNLEVNERDGSVRLSGVVQSYFAKQTAQIIAVHVPGICQLDNEISVA